MSRNEPQSLAELEQWADMVATMEACDTQQGGKPGKDTKAARAALAAALKAAGRQP